LLMPFLITPAWRNFLVACYSEARFEESDPKKLTTPRPLARLSAPSYACPATQR
jgi:hypothetical protein